MKIKNPTSATFYKRQALFTRFKIENFSISKLFDAIIKMKQNGICAHTHKDNPSTKQNPFQLLLSKY